MTRPPRRACRVDDKLGWTLGYPFALRALGVGGPDAPQTLLDYGCGPGKVAERVARRYGLRVIAVDPSAEMLAIASRRYCHPLVTYHQIQRNSLEFLADRSVDAARILLTNGDWLELSDYFWSSRIYQDILAEAGVTDLQVEAPLLADARGLADPADLNAWDYDAERTHAPLILIHGCRPDS